MKLLDYANCFGNVKQRLILKKSLGGNYDFEVVKLFAGAAYFDEAKLSTFAGAGTDWAKANASDSMKIKGWSLGVSAAIPAAGGNVLVGASYMDAEAADSLDSSAYKDAEVSRWIVSAGYDYPLSKRTNVYGVVTYNQDSMDKIGAKDADPTVWGVMLGMRHKF